MSMKENFPDLFQYIFEHTMLIMCQNTIITYGNFLSGHIILGEGEVIVLKSASCPLYSKPKFNLKVSMPTCDLNVHSRIL